MLYYESFEKFLRWCENYTLAGVLIILGSVTMMTIIIRMVLRTSYGDKIKKKQQMNPPIKRYKGVKSWIMTYLNLNSTK